MTSFNWLHLTDLHLGMADHPHLLPAIKNRFFEDLRALREKCGPWDLVLFTGDLAHSGKAQEFQMVDEFLGQLWERLRDLDCQPYLLAIPGNHDLLRPDSKDLSVKVLRNWETDTEVQSEFWNDPRSSYRKTIDVAFENYAKWWEQVALKPSITPGILPGDFSAFIEKDGASLGIVGLNTTFLQLTGGPYKGKLAVDPRQFQAVCDKDGPAWVKKRNACLLLTHQPPDWLTPASQEHLLGEITGYNFFAAHLFGHMHEARYRSAAEGGSPVCRTSQGCSLFGLDHFGEEQTARRSHGYAAGTIEIDGDQGRLIVWPRQASRPGGQWSFAADTTNFLLVEDHIHPEGISVLKSLHPPQSPNGGSVQKPSFTAGERPFPNQWAILVGVNDYQQATALQYCRQDVVEVANTLCRHLEFSRDCILEFHEESDLKPERDLIFRKLAELRDSSRVTPDDLLLFYFSGHGVNASDKDYLLPITASPRDVKTLGIRVEDLVELLQETRCKNIVMFLDACRETVQGAKGTASIGEDSKGISSKAGIVTFFSCDPKDRSYEIEPLEHGSFTYCVLQAIREGAATTVAELDDFLRETVPQLNIRYSKPPQQPYVATNSAQQRELPIFFNPRRSQRQDQTLEPLIDALTGLCAEGKIGEDDFLKSIEFIDQLKGKKQLDSKEKTKLSAIRGLCERSWTLGTFRRVWNGVESRRSPLPQIKKLPPLNQAS